MKRKPRVTRLDDGRWHVQRPPYGFSRTGQASEHRSFQSALYAALGGGSGSAGSSERSTQHDYDQARGPA